MGQRINGCWCELLPAKKYYGPHATGSVILVNGHVHLHGKLADIKGSKYCPQKRS